MIIGIKRSFDAIFPSFYRSYKIHHLKNQVPDQSKFFSQTTHTYTNAGIPMGLLLGGGRRHAAGEKQLDF